MPSSCLLPSSVPCQAHLLCFTSGWPHSGPCAVLPVSLTYGRPYLLSGHLFLFYFIYLFFLLINFILLLLFYFLAVLGLRRCAQAFSSFSEQGLLFVAVRGLLIAMAFLVTEHGL